MVNVLLVEDDAMVSAHLALVLAEAGHRVTTAASAELALRLDEAEPCGLLVTDVALPGRDGAWLARTLRRRRPGLPVLVLSGLPLAAAAFGDGARAHGPTRAATKPVRAWEVRDLVDELAREAGLRGPS